MKRIIAFFVCCVLAFSLISCSKIGDGGNDAQDGSDKQGDDKPSALTRAIWSESTNISEDMLVYYFNSYYRAFVEDYAQSLGDMGLDPSKSLSSQRYDDEYNWQQYMTLLVYNNLREMIALADAAKGEGITLDEAEKQELEQQITNYKNAAETSGVTLSEYAEYVYGEGVTEDTLRNSIELKMLANKYYSNMWEGYSFSEEECLEYYEKNSQNYLHYDCIKITVPAEDAELLKRAESEEAFVEAMRESITKTNFLGDYDRFAELIEKQIAKKYCYRLNYVEGTAVSDWIGSEGRKPYDVFSKEETSGEITVMMLLPPSNASADQVLYRDDEPVKNLKFIFFADDESGTSSLVKAESIYKNWQENPTEERFDELVEKYGGGTTKDIHRGEFVLELTEWIFADGRQVGDVGCVEVEGGAYLIYLLEDGDASWIIDVRESMSLEKYQADINALIDKYPTEYDENVVYSVEEVSLAEA